MTSSTKNENPQLSNFLMQTRSLAASFESLNNSQAQLPGELWSCKVALKYRLKVGF